VRLNRVLLAGGGDDPVAEHRYVLAAGVDDPQRAEPGSTVGLQIDDLDVVGGAERCPAGRMAGPVADIEATVVEQSTGHADDRLRQLLRGRGSQAGQHDEQDGSDCHASSPTGHGHLSSGSRCAGRRRRRSCRVRWSLVPGS
jgi:hypothetical protein